MRFIILRIDEKKSEVVDDFHADIKDQILIRAEYLSDDYKKVTIPD